MGPLVTVITPTTGNPLLQTALDSVATQTYPSIISPEDYFVDVNCFILPKPLASEDRGRERDAARAGASR